jgi:GH15 family glucan-1,4-alpha-glucosidase
MTEERSLTLPSNIEDYALIGDCETAALVDRDGSIDWLCWPSFDSEACFAALLGAPENGRWRIAPSDEITYCERRYRGDSLILETRLETKDPDRLHATARRGVRYRPAGSRRARPDQAEDGADHPFRLRHRYSMGQAHR